MSSLHIFSKRLREARKSRFPSQDALAEALNVHPLTVGRWERGERLPSPEDLDRIVEVLGKPVGWFFDDGSPADERADPPLDSISAIRSHLDGLERALAKQSDEPRNEAVWTDEMVHQLLKQAADSGQVPTAADLQALKGLATSVDELDIGEHSEMAARDDKKKRGKRKDEK